VNHAVIPGIAPAIAAFDRLAASYDEVFTCSVVGRAQRNLVWDKLRQAFHAGDRILEINCGTGEDALFLASRGVSVVACDGSAAMIAVARQKLDRATPPAAVAFHTLPNERLSELTSHALFDGAFSNFSGLNCVASIPDVAASLGKLLQPGGVAILCVSTRFCLWELLWFLLRGKPRKAVRRILGSAMASIHESTVPIFYPTVKEWSRSVAPHFRLRSVRAVGLFVPPSYAETWASTHRRAVSLLEQLDRALGAWPVLRSVGDHILLEFEKVAE
jgi:ubiquinone/menaquinone biosynthesis C-methylase UbiE